jgi:hypothetical protein
MKLLQNNHFYFQVNLTPPHRSMTDPLLFVYQSKFGRKLLTDFGQKYFFLDELSLAPRSHLHLLMLFVKTKIGFQPAAFIVSGLTTSDPNSSSLSEGLKFLAENNSSWSPKYCICFNVSEAVPALIETGLPAVKVVVDDCAREKAWNEFLAFSDLENVFKEEILKELEALANLTNELEVENQIEICRRALTKCGNSFVRNYFEDNWLKSPERWVWALACVKMLARDKSRFFLDLDSGKSRISDKSTFARTRRLIPLPEIIQDILKEYLPKVK